MEGLIGFLFDNLFLVIIVLGILSTLFGRSGRKGGGGRMPDFGGGPGGWPAPGQGLPRGMRRPGETPRRPEVSRLPERSDAGGGEAAFPRERRPGRQLDERGREVIADARRLRAGDALPGTAPADRYAAASSASGAERPSSASDAPAARADAASQVAPALQVEHAAVRPVIGRSELRNAVIWAEILGPPRALKPRGRRRIGR